MDKFQFSGWFGFWLFMTVYIIIEAVMYFNGHDTYFWKHKTQAELTIQQSKIQQQVTNKE